MQPALPAAPAPPSVKNVESALSPNHLAKKGRCAARSTPHRCHVRRAAAQPHHPTSKNVHHSLGLAHTHAHTGTKSRCWETREIACSRGRCLRAQRSWQHTDCRQEPRCGCCLGRATAPAANWGNGAPIGTYRGERCSKGKMVSCPLVDGVRGVNALHRAVKMYVCVGAGAPPCTAKSGARAGRAASLLGLRRRAAVAGPLHSCHGPVVQSHAERAPWVPKKVIAHAVAVNALSPASVSHTLTSQPMRLLDPQNA